MLLAKQTNLLCEHGMHGITRKLFFYVFIYFYLLIFFGLRQFN